MATEVEERIVAAKFDSTDFEKGVNKTVKKLDELKESLDFKKTGESLEKFGKKTSEATENASKSLEKLSERFTTFTGMIKQKLLSGLADQVTNTFFRMEHAITGFFRSMSTGQISAGMQKFESALTAVRMITQASYEEIDAATGKKTGKKLKYTSDEAYSSVEALRAYADETSYSMDQMVDSMSKMVAAGVKLEDAEKNVQGIANACAAAGVNAQDAARAFFNLSQAYSAGKLQYTDYRSLQLLNMTNENFEEAFLAAGVAAGTLEAKKGKNGKTVYKTKRGKKGKNGKQSNVTAGKTISRQSMGLNYGWATTDVLDILFGQSYYVDVEDFQKAKQYSMNKNNNIYRAKDALEYLKAIETVDKVTGKTVKKYSDLAASAFMAAREARNFRDVIQAVGEYVSSKWSTVFEHLFGRLEEASEFFTSLSEGGIASFFTEPMDWLVDVLDKWDEVGKGGEAFRDVILSLDAAVGNFLGVFNDMLPGADEFGNILFALTQDLSVAAQHIQELSQVYRAWLTEGTMSDGMERLKKIQDTIADISGVFMVVGKVVGLAFDTMVHAMQTFSPIIDGVINLFNELVKPIGQLGSREYTEPFDRIKYAIDSVFSVLDPLMKSLAPWIEKIGTWLGKIGGFFLDMAIQGAVMNIEFFADAVSLLIELFSGRAGEMLENGEGVIGSIGKDIASIGEVCSSALGAVKEFFDTLIKDVRTILGLPAEEGQAAGEANQEGGLFSGLKNFFETNEFIQQAQAWVEQAKNDIIKWFSDLPQTISNFINNLLYEPLTKKVDSGSNAAGQVDMIVGYVETPLKQWLDTAVDTVAKFIADIPTKLLEGIGTIGNFVSMVINAIFGSKDGAEAKKDADTKKQEDQTTNAIKEWADKFSERFQKEIKLLPMRIRMYIRIYSRKMKATWNNFKTWFNNDETIATIKEWGASIFNSIKDFILKLPEHIMNLIKSVGATGRSIIGTIKELFKSDDVSKETQKELEDGFNGISVQGVLNTIADIGKEIVNQFLSWFTGSEDMAGNFEWLGEQVSNMIKAIPAAIEGAVDWVILQLGNLWDNLYKALVGEKDQNGKDKYPVNSRVKEKLDELTDKNGNLNLGIENIVEIARAAFEDAGKILGDLWDDLINALTGKNKKTVTPEMWRDLDKYGPEKQLEVKQGWAKEGFNVPGVKVGFEKFVDDLGKAIVDLFAKIPGWITEGLNVAVTGINTALEWLTNNLSTNIGKSEEEVAENVDKDDPAASGLEASFTKLGTNISNLIFKTIPGAIATGFDWVKEKADKEWIPSVIGLFASINENKEFIDAVGNVGDNIVQWIKDLPEKIRNTFEDIKIKIKSMISGKPEEVVKILENPAVPNAVKNGINWIWDNAGKKTAEGVENSTLWGTITSTVGEIGAALSEAFNALFPDIETWFAELPVKIVNGLNAALTFINDQVGGIAKWFEELNKVDEKEASEQIEGAITNATEEAGKGAENAVKKKGDSPFKTAMLGLGATIRKAITETIPAAILSGFEYVRSHWKEWTAGLFNFFADDEHKIKADDINISGLADALITKLKELPGKITEEIDKLKRTFFKKDMPKEFIDAYNRAGDNIAAKQSLLKTWDSQGYNISQITGEKTILDKFADFGGSLGKSIADGIKWAIENLPQMIIDGWNNSIQILNGLIGSIADWFDGGDLKSDDNQLGDKIQEHFKETQSPEIQKSLTGIGQSLVTLFKDTIPRFLGSGIGQLINWVPDMINAFMEGLNGALNQGIKEQTPNLVNDVSDTTKEAIDKATGVNLEEELVRKIVNDRNYRDWLLLDNFQQTRINQDRFKEGLELYVDTDLKEKSQIVKDLLENDTLYDQVKTYLNSDERQKQWMESAWSGEGYTEIFKRVRKIMKDAEDLSYGEAAVKNVKAGIEGAGDVLNLLFTTAFNVDKDGNVTGLSTESWIVIGAVLVTKLCELIEHIKEIPRFSSTERVMANNSIEHVLSLALIITGIGMGFATIASQLNDKQFNNAMTAFDKVSDLISQIVTWYGVIKGTGTIADVIGALNGGGGDVVNMGLNLGAFGTLAGISALVDTLTSDFAAIGGVIKTFAGNLGETALTLVEGTGNIAAAVTVMDDAIALLGKTKEISGFYSDAITASAVLNQLSPSLGLFMTNTSTKHFKSKDTVEAIEQLIGLTDKMGEFSRWATNENGEFANFKYAISSLGSAISLFSNPELSSAIISDETIEAAIKFLKSLVGDDEFLGLASQLSDANLDLKPLEMQESAESLVILATAISRLGPAAIQMKDVSADDISSMFQKIASIEFGTHGNTAAISEVAANMLSLGSGLSSLAAGASGLTSDNVALAGLALDMVAKLAKNAEGFQVSFFEALSKGGGDLNTFGGALGDLGTNLATFFDKINPYASEDKLLQNKSALSGLYGILSQLSQLAAATRGTNIYDLTAWMSKESGFSAFLVEFIQELEKADLSENAIKKVTDITNIYKSLFIGIGQMQGAIKNSDEIMKFSSNLFSNNKYDTPDGLLANILNFIIYLNEQLGEATEETDQISKKIENAVPIFDILKSMLTTMSSLFVENGTTIDYTGITKALDESFNYINNNFDLINSIINKVGEVDTSKLEKARMLFASIRDLGEALSYFTQKSYYGSFDATATDGLVQLYSFDYDTLRLVIEKFINTIDDIFAEETTAESIKSSGKTMASYLFEGMQEAFNTDTSLQLHITPVFDYPSNMPDGISLDGSNIDFGSSVGQVANLAFSANEQNAPSDYSIVLTEMNGKLSDLDSKLNSINSNTGAIIPAFAGARLIIDTNALAVQMGPAMDRWLATAGYLYLRHNSQ